MPLEIRLIGTNVIKISHKNFQISKLIRIQKAYIHLIYDFDGLDMNTIHNDQLSHENM